MRKVSSLLLTTALCVGVAVPPALADEGHHWHGDDIHRFHEQDYGHWREGGWRHGFHDGRNGWWWVVAGAWYFYPAPVYPYPDPYTPSTVIVESAPVAPQVVAPPSSVYYCTNPAGYYPYVARCFDTWQRVVSQTTVVTPQQAAPVVVPQPQSQRDADDQQLNAYDRRFATIDLRNPHARTELRTLEKQVEAFRQSLFQRSYNAMDLLQNAETHVHRIAEQRKKLATH